MKIICTKTNKIPKPPKRKEPNLDTLLENGKVVVETEVKYDVPGGYGGSSINFVRVNLSRDVPSGFNDKFMGYQQSADSDCRRKVRVTIELL